MAYTDLWRFFSYGYGTFDCSEFLVPILSNPEVDLESQTASLDHLIPAFRLVESANGSNGFTLVGSEAPTTGSLSHIMKVSSCEETS